MMFIVLTFGSSETARALNTDPSETGLRTLPVKGGSGFAILCLLADGDKPHFRVRQYTKGQGLSSLGRHFCEKGCEISRFSHFTAPRTFSDAQRTL
ncbi:MULTISPECIES: hypothetical protein [Rhizobium]|uniref:hypothetical protein n=1 Tax=Rhizobium TaxID=379 RepID=UPI00103AC00F|nr:MULTISPECIES: hypothetical protein [Rhizobium]KAF5880517.1 hypothetical protein FY112_35085 [Rhizobium sp. PEPV16]MBY5824887.1 hypothetical protein [Rhizobium leguminosarum]TBY83118.1 hypothetical protein E0H32_12055 [Rhizobium leguminosarum bv. viciae]